MAHSRCMTYRARVRREGDRADHLGDLCPGCGGSLAPVSDLSELVGLRSLRARPRAAGKALPDRSQRIAAEIRATIARHDAERQRRTDADRGHDREREPHDGHPRVS
jgi:hypothetical protein